MRAVLYDSDGGYYNSLDERIGPAGDFYTAPATHPAFGALLALQLERCWELLHKPQSFTIIEEGGGKGRLAQDIFNYSRHLAAEFSQAIDYRIVEFGRNGRVTPSRDDDAEIVIDWDGDALPDKIEAGVIISNELYDAMPRYRVIQQGDTLYELLVDATDAGFIETIAEPSTPALAERLRQLDITLPNGSKAEIDLGGTAHLTESASRLGRGFVLTIDYGFPAATLYDGSRREGTLLCYHHHTSSTNPYIRLGRQDITAHVDFTSLAWAGEEAGLLTEGLLTQQRYLKKLGAQAFIDALREIDIPPQDIMANRMAILELTKPTGFGGFGVLIHSTGTEDGGPYGVDEVVISRARGGLDGLPPVLLTPNHMPLLAGRYPQYSELDNIWPSTQIPETKEVSTGGNQQ
ncbi:MAG: class I SAM-dependent methyltransferase [Chloroflexi bacterium]|nr:class I SAM-dependent methyltransferase [Chloroflexota bacterium]